MKPQMPLLYLVVLVCYQNQQVQLEQRVMLFIQ